MRALYDGRARATYIDVVDPPHESDNRVDESVAGHLFVPVGAGDRVVGIKIPDADDIAAAVLPALASRRGHARRRRPGGGMRVLPA